MTAEHPASYMYRGVEEAGTSYSFDLMSGGRTDSESL